jgi:hypothetical protein
VLPSVRQLQERDARADEYCTEYWRILGVIVWNYMQLDGYADFLRPFIWSLVSAMMGFRNGTDKEIASNFVQISTNWDEDLNND